MATPWREAAARAAVRAIAADALACFTPEGLWPAHPLDEPDAPLSAIGCRVRCVSTRVGSGARQSEAG